MYFAVEPVNPASCEFPQIEGQWTLDSFRLPQIPPALLCLQCAAGSCGEWYDFL